MGQKGEERKAHLKSWRKLADLNENGGLGFREMQIFNIALLVRMAWRLYANPDALCAMVLKGLYFLRKELGVAKKGRKSS